MIKFREHRGSLEESMKTVQEFSSRKDLIEHISKRFDPYEIYSDIKFEHVGFDSRVGWDTYYVLAKFKINDESFVAGMSDGQFRS